jgi:hypothetical protein
MKNWFRKIETETHDVLIKRSRENDSESVEIIISTELCEVTKTLGFKEDSEKADAKFKEIDKEYCLKFINAVEQTFSDLNINQPDEEADKNPS